MSANLDYVLNLRARRDELEQENAKLRAVIERLPQTADGVPITPNTRYFYLHSNGEISECNGLTLMNWVDNRCVDHAYSTREAALAAKGATQ